MLEKNTESQVHVEKIEERADGTSIAFGLERIGLIAVQAPDPVLHHPRRADHRRDLRHRAHQDRRFAQPVVPLQFQGLQAIRGGDQALPGDRIRRAGRGRRQDAAGARESREAARHGHRPAARRRHARSGLAVLGAPGAGARQAAGGAVSARTAGRRGLRQIHRDREIQRDHSRQAVVRGRHAGADRAVARTRSRLQQRAQQGGRRYPQDHGRGSRRQRAQRAALRRSRHAARNPQRGRSATG